MMNRWMLGIGLAAVLSNGCVSRVNVTRITTPALAGANDGVSGAKPPDAKGSPDTKTETNAEPKYERTPEAAEAMRRGGVYYALPRTRVIAEVPVERTIFTPGIFAKHAPKCLDLPASEVGTRPEISFAILPGTLTAVNEPDPAQVFLMDIRGRYFENKSLKAAFSSAGTLSSLTVESDDQSVQVALEALKAASGLASKAAGLGASAVAAATEKTDGQADKACSAYKEVLQGRARIIDEIQGAVPKETLDRVLAEWDEAIRSVREYYFTGTEQKTVSTRRFAHLPDKRGSVKLLGFDGEGGVCSTSNLLVGQSFPKSASAAGTLSALSAQIQDLEKRKGDYAATDYESARKNLDALATLANRQVCSCKESQGEIAACLQSAGVRGVKNEDLTVAPPLEILYSRPVDSLASVLHGVNETGKRGLYYRVPEDVRVSVSIKDGKHFAAATLEIAQFGPVVSMPNSTGGRKTAYTADFTPGGALKNFQVNSTALLDKSLVESLQSTAESAMDAAAKASDRAAQLKKKTDLLKAEKELLDAQKELDEAKKATGTGQAGSAPSQQ